jgi:conjugative transfer signal peptidase TraF
MTRATILLASSLAVAGLCLARPTPRLVWNATASTPVGLYALSAAGSPRAGDLVAVRPPEPVADILAKGGFLPRGVLLLKPAAALPAQTVCRNGDAVSIDGRRVGAALDRDHLGRPLPRWSGCRRLRPGELFLMNPAVPQSLDGRYFGPLPGATVVGRARPIWTQARRRGRFAWRPGAAPFPASPARQGDFPWRPSASSPAIPPASPGGCAPSASTSR